MARTNTVRVIDSHTEGEPTRVVVDGAPALPGATPSDYRQMLANQHDDIRQRLILEPRGSDAMVGAMLVPPTRDDCVAGVVFFNNTGYLNMCGHGAMGVAVTLHYLGKVLPGALRLETPVGVVSVTLHDAHQATVKNVASYCLQRDVTVDVPEIGCVTGDIAWGGNWFFLAHEAPCDIVLVNEPELTRAALAIKAALVRERIYGEGNAEIDHIEFFAPTENADSKNFVLCPGGAYDRSPCGTGTSAKLACLADAGTLAPGQQWVQESVIGSRFTASFEASTGGKIIPSITGTAYVVADSTIIAQAGDPFANGIAS